MIKNSQNKGFLLGLISILMMFTFYKPMVLGNFLLHRDYIIKNLCVQKDNQIDCYGKCHLKKIFKNTSTNQEDIVNDLNTLERLFEMNLFDIEIVFLDVIDKEVVIQKNKEYNHHFVQPYLEIKTPPPQFFS